MVNWHTNNACLSISRSCRPLRHALQRLHSRGPWTKLCPDISPVHNINSASGFAYLALPMLQSRTMVYDCQTTAFRQLDMCPAWPNSLLLPVLGYTTPSSTGVLPNQAKSFLTTKTPKPRYLEVALCLYLYICGPPCLASCCRCPTRHSEERSPAPDTC
jgi:hypothetical protein